MSTVTDPIADFLARVRNGARAQQPEVLIPYSKIKAEIARILKEEGYISDYSLDTSGARPRIKVLFLSGDASEDAPTDELPRGAFLHKPFTPEALARKVRTLLDR